ncbi:unnamed protein product [Mytilus coruscus]|uniref:C1q domain-containing protein n=1 Tax=Mytilus coruscus TaxID=42192 RepID=A0A6J8E7W4_MYTCO|nr:unnamed protein product [Mytilus coruscus]
MPLREIINSTIECKINEELKEYTVSSQRDINGQLKTLQHMIDVHIGDNGVQFTDVKRDIASLRIETGETITHEILEQKKDMTKLVDTLKSDQGEKMKNLTSNVVLMQSEVQKKVDEHIVDSRDEFTLVKQDIATLRKEMAIVNTVNKNLDEKVKNLNKNVEIMQSELKETILSVDNNVSILVETLVKHSDRLDALHSNIREFTGKTSAIQSIMNTVRSRANINNKLLGGHDSRLNDLNAKVNAMNSRVALTAHPSSGGTLHGILKFDNVKFSVGINNLPTYRSTGKFVVEKEGLYLIAVSIFSDANNAYFYIYLNGNRISETRIGYTSSPPSLMQHTGTVVVVRQLLLNDSLWVSFPGTYYIHGDVHCPLYLRLESNSLITVCNEQNLPNDQSRQKINKWDHKMVPEFRANINVDRLDRLLRNLKNVNLEKVDDNNVNAFVNEIGLVVLESAKTTFGTRTDKPKSEPLKRRETSHGLIMTANLRGKTLESLSAGSNFHLRFYYITKLKMLRENIKKLWTKP